MKSTPAEIRFWPKVDAEGDCWEWTANKRTGYGQWRDENGRLVQAHRWSWEQLVGPIPNGLTLDHLCRNRACVNPDHLEPVTNAENIRRGYGGRMSAAVSLAKTHCPYDHPYSGSNLYIAPNGQRMCRACRRRRSREWKLR